MEILASRVLFRPSDYPVSLAFYRDALGLAIAREYPGGTVFFRGPVTDRTGRPRPPADSTGPFPGALWLQVRDIHAISDELQARGVTIAREARQEPWGLYGCTSRTPTEST